jgi:putative acyl-CoA dehydrogenase
MVATPFPNQPPAYEGRNLLRTDAILVDAAAHIGLPASGLAELERWGSMLGSSAAFADAAAANRAPPRLVSHDRRGERIDAVEFDRAWHRLMALAAAAREHNAPWARPSAHAQTMRAIAYYLHAQVENGTQCPLTMTYAAIPLLQRHAGIGGIGARFLPRAMADRYDASDCVIDAKQGALFGMGMTERQGGSDVRANVTTAQRDGTRYLIRGHKWFFSAPQCDAHLVLAQTADGPGCFFMPRWLEDGTRNAIRIERLKDKLGNRSNASAEVTFDNAHAWLLGDPGRGIATILDMVQLTRLDCVIGSAGMMRSALAWALHWATHRVAFGRPLAQQPLMVNVLADLALETEAALRLALALAGSFEADADERSRALARLLVPAAKYWVCKRAPMVALEAMEVMGGSGYVEEQPLPRLYREAPVNSIWEGSGNVICLDVLRATQRHPEAVDALRDMLHDVRGQNADLDRAAARFATLGAGAADAHGARRLAQAVATTLAGALLVRSAPAPVAAAYCASRLGDDAFAGAAFGTLADAGQAAAVLARATAA